MKFTLQRLTGPGQPRTFGEWRDATGQRLAHTLEDCVREKPGVPVEKWKIKGETAIPAGRYRITLENSGRFGPDTTTINSVPGFVAIRVHGGNTEQDTEGCPLLGLNRSAMGISNCAPAVAKVKALVKAVIAAGDSVWLDIINKPT